MANHKTISWEIINEVGHLVLNQPPANELTSDFFLEFNDLVLNIISDSDVKAILIYGQGRHFSSGANLDELISDIHDNIKIDKEGNIIDYPKFVQQNLNGFLALDQLQIPVIAVIQGVCLGAAFELAMFCHFRICSDNAVLGLPESSFNLMPGIGGVQKIIELAPHAKAMELVIKGDNFNASDGLKYGLIDRIVPKKKLISAAEQLAKIASSRYRRFNKNEYLMELDKFVAEKVI